MTTLRCAILDDYQGVALALADWASLADRVEVRSFTHHFASDDELVAAIGEHEIVVIMRERTAFHAELLARLPRLRLLITSGLQNTAIDVAAAKARGIVVCGTPSASEPPAELTWALILALCRHVVREAHAFRSGGPWQSTLGIDLHGKQLGLLGLGKIGERVARVGAAFGMEVLAWSPNLDAERARACGAWLAGSKHELLASSDVLSIHVRLGPRSRGTIGAEELRRMRPTALLVNTSRAEIVDQDALVRALREGWIAGAAADVFETEPLPLEHPLRSLPSFLGTPHLGYVTDANYRRYFEGAVEDIGAWLAGSPLRELA
jgi:phosphoglycerate dehydrogenase-like enzyme